ncbi:MULTISPECIES: hypothetical protein [unclassified Lentimicrobium]|uniref:hypothetical protein n=1 Tax=unclassified Lentimicrobium TaxID=2677434 RepID=UPI0015547EAF|nr:MULTISPECIES: hypothetical protein [unclassified Lentimicrobium]NPD44626.1 hypothetical protein [Lentimicrobium sp. S6]NPD83338.1 hypothetical protein [Lentimicrobium sp. L6]
MKNKITYLLVVISGLLLANVNAQGLLPAEKAETWTDRAIYISGEEICFSGILSISDEDELLSTVVYVELISPENQKINQTKLPVIDQSYSGKLIIPEDVLSGYYFLRTYTKWMRNGSPYDYHYNLLKVINPFQKEVLDIKDSLIVHETISKLKPNADLLVSKSKYTVGDPLVIHLDKSVAEFKNPSVSMIPAGSQAFKLNKTKPKVEYYYQMKYEAETRGLSLSGKILVNGHVSPFHQLNVHILGEKDFISVLCDADGHFNVALVEDFNEKELFLIAGSSEEGKVEIQIDQDFCTKKINLNTPKFTVEKAEKEILLKMAKRQQIASIYESKPIVKNKTRKKKAFYGSVFKTIDFDFYVPLDSMSQYFTDLPSWVTIKKKKGKRSLHLIGTQAELNIYPSLVMVDWVPVDEADRVLAMNPKLVKEIEVINQAYVHGNQIYGGVIHIKTRKGDFGNMRFPESGQYLNYLFYSFNMSNLQTQQSFSNTIYWKTDLKDFSDIHLQTPLFSGKYLIMIQGIDENGEYAWQAQEIQVGN